MGTIIQLTTAAVQLAVNTLRPGTYDGTWCGNVITVAATELLDLETIDGVRGAIECKVHVAHGGKVTARTL